MVELLTIFLKLKTSNPRISYMFSRLQVELNGQTIETKYTISAKYPYIEPPLHKSPTKVTNIYVRSTYFTKDSKY